MLSLLYYLTLVPNYWSWSGKGLLTNPHMQFKEGANLNNNLKHQHSFISRKSSTLTEESLSGLAD